MADQHKGCAVPIFGGLVAQHDLVRYRFAKTRSASSTSALRVELSFRLGAKPVKRKAEEQLGIIGSGNHYVDLFTDEEGSRLDRCALRSRVSAHGSQVGKDLRTYWAAKADRESRQEAT